MKLTTFIKISEILVVQVVTFLPLVQTFGLMVGRPTWPHASVRKVNARRTTFMVAEEAQSSYPSTTHREKSGKKPTKNWSIWPNSPPTNDESFQKLIYTLSSSSSSKEVLHIPTSSTTARSSSTRDSPVLKSLDYKIQKTTRKRNKYQKKVVEYTKKLTKLEQRKETILNLPPSKQNIISETSLRSATKAFMWRIIAGSITLITSLNLSNNNILLALRVVGSDFFSKALTMFIGERLMNQSQAGRSDGSDSRSRSIAKALIWRLFAISNTLVAVLFFGGGDIKLASKIAGSDAIFKTVLMVFYERLWAKVEWGKDYAFEEG